MTMILSDCDAYFDETQKCYTLFKEKLTWDEARQSCEDKASELASIMEPKTNDFLMGLTQNLAWIGGYVGKWEGEDTWFWTDDSTLSYENWYDQDSIHSEAKVISNIIKPRVLVRFL